MPRVLFLFTGGTISMKFDPATGGAVPALSGHEILAFDPGLASLAEPEVIDFGRFPGPHMTPDRAWAVSDLLIKQLGRADIDAAIVTHGTDTLEETAYLCDLRHRSEKPVAFAGAMRNSSELSFDGPANLRAALRTVLSAEARGQGVFVVLNQFVHAASEVTKTDAQMIETFQSPMFGPLALVDADRVVWARRLVSRTVIETNALEPHVDLIYVHAGSDSRFIDFARESGTRGIVIAGTGRGNVPPSVLPGIQRALDAGLHVLIASRCPRGRVLDTYAYEGSGHDLRKRGVLFAGTLPAHKARVKLMLALGRTCDQAHLRRLIEQDYE